MNVPSDRLDRWRAFIERVRQTALNARILYMKGDFTKARALLQQLHDAASLTAQSMERAGAERPGGMIAAPVVPVERRSTPKSRRYLLALQEAHEAAVELAVERGYGDEGAGPASGMLEMLLADAQEEVNGAAGLVRE